MAISSKLCTLITTYKATYKVNTDCSGHVVNDIAIIVALSRSQIVSVSNSISRANSVPNGSADHHPVQHPVVLDDASILKTSSDHVLQVESWTVHN